jgi:hypothetical protein
MNKFHYSIALHCVILFYKNCLEQVDSESSSSFGSITSFDATSDPIEDDEDNEGVVVNRVCVCVCKKERERGDLRPHSPLNYSSLTLLTLLQSLSNFPSKDYKEQIFRLLI